MPPDRDNQKCNDDAEGERESNQDNWFKLHGNQTHRTEISNKEMYIKQQRCTVDEAKCSKNMKRIPSK